MMQTQKQLKPFQLLKNNVNFKLPIGKVFLFFPRFSKLYMYLLRPLYLNKETFINKGFRWLMLSLGAGQTPVPETRALRYLAMAVHDNFKAVLKAEKNKDTIIWVEWIMHPEVCEAFDVISFNPEALNVFANVKGTEYPPMLIEAAENQGTPIENCSALKCTIGSLLLKQIPEPSIIIGASHPCDTSVTVYQTLEYLTGAPSFTMDVPYWKDADAYSYYEKYTWEMIGFLENQLGKKINWDKLKDTLERVDKVNYYLKEVCEMSRAVPCPSSLSALTFAWVAREVNIGSPHILKMAETLYNATKKRFDTGKGIIKKEKVRVLLWFPPISFFSYYFQWMEDNFGAVVVADFIGHISTIHIDTSSKETMVRDLAKAQMNLAMGRQCHGPMEFITDEMEKLIEEYSIDCMIFSGHNGCKHGWAGVKIVQDICKKRKLPTLYLSLDIMDNRHTSEQQIKDQTTEFFKNHNWA